MQNIEVSNEAYQMFMKYSSKTGESASSIIKALIKNAEDDEKCTPDNEKIAVLEKDCAKILRETKRWASHEEVFKRCIE